jgi:aryl-alcohol dehydrogenase-like predicted oxidoreductase
MEPRILGRSGIKVSPLGLGTARIGGLGWHDELPPINFSRARREAIHQIRRAVDLGVTFFDTADNYGQGFCEQVLGEALRNRKKDIIVATKFGENPHLDQQDPWLLSESLVTRACENSLRRLGFECIDLYLLHRRDYPLEQVPSIIEVLEELVQAGKIRYYGWSTDDVNRAKTMAHGEHCIAIEHRLNAINDNPEMLDLCNEEGLVSINRVPLLMGVLKTKFTKNTQLEEDDPRSKWFELEEFIKLLSCVHQIEPYLTSNNRSAVQGALGWIWARSSITIPVPGFRNMEQMQELIQSMQFEALPYDAMQAINEKVKSFGI